MELISHYRILLLCDIFYIDQFRNSESGIVQQITDTKAKLKAKYPECFEGLGKLKDVQLKIAIDENV